MGMSTVDYRGRQFAAPDGLLELWLHLVAEQIGNVTDAPQWLNELKEDWHDQATQGFGFGIVPNLDKWAIDESHATALLNVFRQTVTALEQSHATYTGSQRDSLGLGGGHPSAGMTGDYTRSEVIELGERFIDLMHSK